jgi:glycosyltransferase involved in cell wall biosynthesis
MGMLTIVVPTLNAANSLAATLESLSAQTYRKFQVIVVDGKSSDGTLEIVESFRNRLPDLLLLVGRDSGVYGAINRGIQAALGEWILVLGSDDRLLRPSTLAMAIDKLDRVKSTIAYGDVLVRGNNAYLSEGERYAGRFNLAQLTKRNVCQQSIFYRRSLFARVGYFETRFRVCADWAFLLRHFLRERPEWLDLVVAEYHAGGISSRVIDVEFARSRPMIILRSMVANPFHPEVQRERWLLRRLAAECAPAGFGARAAALNLGWALLALTSRLSMYRMSRL